MTVVYNVGDLAAWLSALGGIGSVGAAIWIARGQQKEARRQVEAKEAEDYFHQTAVVRQTSDLVDTLISRINGSSLSFDGLEWQEYSETARYVNSVAERVQILSNYPVLSPSRRLGLEAVVAACSLPRASIHGSPSLVTHELRQLLSRLQTAKSALLPMM